MRRFILQATLSILFAGGAWGGVAGAHIQDTKVLKATILGSGSPQYNPDRAGPGVLISYGDTEILVDIGNGIQARLNEHGTQIRDLEGLLFTHHHLDHNEEFIPVYIRSLLGNNKITLAGPSPMKAMSASTLEQYKEDIEYRMRRSGRKLADVKKNVTLKELKGGERFEIGDIQVTTTKVNHTIYTTALRFDAGGQSVVISGDLTYSESLSKLAKDADYLLIDSGGTKKIGNTRRRQSNARANANNRREGRSQNRNQERRGQRRDGRTRAHVTLAETAKMATDANVSTLVLTHFTAGTIDEAGTVADLRENYNGRIIFGADLMDVTTAKAFGESGGSKTNMSKLSGVNPCTVTLDIANAVSFSESAEKRSIISNAIPAHKVGTFPTQGNPNTISAQNKSYAVPMTPQIADAPTFVYDNGIDRGRPAVVFGVALNGVKIEPMANEFFGGRNTPNTDWPLEALSPEVYLGEDCNNAHVQPNGEYHYHGKPKGLVEAIEATSDQSDMMLIGWAADGFPIYFGKAYEDANDAKSGLVSMTSSWQLRQGTRPGDGQTAPDGTYTGKYVRDYEFIEGSGALDKCHGRFGVTPEFGEGTYYYMITEAFPFVGRCLVGTPDESFKIGGRNRGEGRQQSQERQRRPQDGNRQRRSPDEILKRMDRNKDGKISKAEARGPLKENFDRIDADDDGFISKAELESNRRR